MDIQKGREDFDRIAEHYKKEWGLDIRIPEEAHIASCIADRAASGKSFYFFVRQAWRHINDGPLIDGWHIAALCYHLQSLWEGKLRDENNEPTNILVANIPPGCSKSTIACVLFSTWLWTKHPSIGQWYSTFGQELCTRDSMRTRDLIRTQWFQDRWGDQLSIVENQDQKQLYRTTQGGWRLAASVRAGKGFGWHPDIFTFDDLLNPKQASSEAERQTVIDYLSGMASTRGIVKGVKWAMVCQRLCEGDPPGYLLERGGVCHLRIPMEFEPENKCVTNITYDEIGEANKLTVKQQWEDPRTEPGELMWPRGMDEKKIAVLKKGLKHAHMIAGQLQQRPTAPDGDMFRNEWFTVVDAPPPAGKALRAWDKASSTKRRSDHTVGALLVFFEEQWYIVDVLRGKWQRKRRDDIIRKTTEKDAERWGDYQVWFEQEGGSAGKDAAQIGAQQLAGYRVKIHRPTGKKETRWEAMADAFSNGWIRLVKGKWNADFITEALAAPFGKHDDQLDAASLAFNKLAVRRNRGKLTRPLLGMDEDEVQDVKAECPICFGRGCEICNVPRPGDDELATLLMGSAGPRDELGVRW